MGGDGKVRPGNRTSGRMAKAVMAATTQSTIATSVAGKLPLATAMPMIAPPKPVPSAEPSTEASPIEAVAAPSCPCGAVSNTTRLMVE